MSLIEEITETQEEIQQFRERIEELRAQPRPTNLGKRVVAKQELSTLEALVQESEQRLIDLEAQQE